MEIPNSLRQFAAALLLTLPLCTQAAADRVSCKVGERELAVGAIDVHHNYSPSGQHGMSGHQSLFRLMTRDEGEGPSSGIEFKTADVLGPGDYPLSTRRTWRSLLRWQGRKHPVDEGRFQFSRFELSGTRGRAVGQVEFRAGGLAGSCRFDVEIKAVDRDRLGLGAP